MDMQTSTWIATEVVSAKNVTAIASSVGFFFCR
jgi:hypothetical protein